MVQQKASISFPNMCYSFQKEKYRNIIKAHIMQFGSVDMGISSYGFSYGDVTTNIGIPGVDPIEHAVSIIGWDDNFSKDNFSTELKQDGAWIVLNSWGDDWGDAGYFYWPYELTNAVDFYRFN